jgi:hypothetical protein
MFHQNNAVEFNSTIESNLLGNISMDYEVTIYLLIMYPIFV